MGEWCGRPLRLQYPPDAEHAAAHADRMVAAAREIDGLTLDYTPESLAEVERIIDGFVADGATSDDVAETLWGFGCYLGEVFVRNGDFEWIDATEEILAGVGFPVVVAGPNGSVANPIGKVFKRMDNGEEDNLPYFYRVFTDSPSR